MPDVRRRFGSLAAPCRLITVLLLCLLGGACGDRLLQIGGGLRGRGRRCWLGGFLRQFGMEQRLQILARGLGQRHQALGGVLAAGAHLADMHRHRAAADRGSKAEEMAALQIADALRLPPVDPRRDAAIRAYRDASREIASVIFPDPDNPHNQNTRPR